MIDPVTTVTLWIFWEKLAEPLIAEACKDHLKDKLKGLFDWIGAHPKRDELQRAYEQALKDAYGISIDKLLSGLKLMGVDDRGLQDYDASLRCFMKNGRVADELLETVKNPTDPVRPRAEVLRMEWQTMECRPLPDDSLWGVVAAAVRNYAKQKTFLTRELREVLNARNQDETVRLLQTLVGVPVLVRQDKYASRMRIRYVPVDLANLMPSYAEDPGRLVIRDVFVPQTVREDPPPVELPKDLSDRLRGKRKRAEGEAEEGDEDVDRRQMELMRTGYQSRSPQPVLDVIAAPANRLVVLIGEPGSGKTTLLRYLLLGVLEPPRDAQAGLPLPWTLPFEDTFPLLIELRDYYATSQREPNVDSFLDYVRYLGHAENWAVDDHWLDQRLRTGRSLVLFDGLDEVFDRGDRERVMQAIAGFAQEYDRARIVVTSRPLSYHDRKTILREAGFTLYGIQDLDDAQIETFTRGWFALTFPRDPGQAQQRIARVLDSTRRSRPIRLLAGNPMLLTIMALLAREQELPRERAKFYEKAVEVLCHHWDANRNLNVPGLDYLRVDDKLELLRRVAMRMQTGPGGLAGNFIHQDDLEAEIAAWFAERFKQPECDAILAARTMIDQLRQRNYILCLRSPQLYGFVHRTFLEYLTAAEYVRQFNVAQTMKEDDLIALFDAHCREDEWREVLRLISGQIDELFVGRVIEIFGAHAGLQHWNGESPLPELPLAIQCLAEVRNPSKLASAGDLLLQTVIRCISVKGQSGLSDFLRDHLLPASRELGVTWPILTPIGERAFEIGDSILGWGDLYWPEFVAIVHSDRSIVERFLNSAKWEFRSSACRALAEKWPDERTRALLEKRAVEDENEYPRRAALQSLAEKWPDERTRALLEKRAVEDENEYPRRAALESLAEKWPDERTRALLEKRAVEDPDKQPRGAACSALGKMHSEFGRILPTPGLNGSWPYLDPLEPIPREHIERAAKQAGIPAEEIDAQVASLSAFLGWDITRGAKEKRENAAGPAE